MELAHAEIVTKREQVRAQMMTNATPRASAAVEKIAAGIDVDAVKSKLWTGSAAGKGVDDTESDSESLIKGGDAAPKKKVIMLAEPGIIGVSSSSATTTTTAAAAAAASGGGSAVDRATERAQKALEERQKQAERDAKWAKFAPKLAASGASVGQARDDTAITKTSKMGADASDSEDDAAPVVTSKQSAADKADKAALEESADESNLELKNERKKKKRVKKTGDDADGKKKKKKKKKAVNVMRTTWGGGGALTSAKVKFGDDEISNNAHESPAARFRSEAGGFRVGDVAHKRNPNDPPPKPSGAATALKKREVAVAGFSRAADVPEPGVVRPLTPKADTLTPAPPEKKASFVRSLFSKKSSTPEKK